MPTANTRTFKSGNSQAMRLPKEVAYDGDVDLTIIRSGEVLTVFPRRKRTMAEFLAALAALPKPSEIEARDVDIIPERPGLFD